MITLQLTQSQYEFVKHAVAAYNDSLIRAIDSPKTSNTVTVTAVSPVVTPRYGVKKDGTPRKAPGRKKVRS